MPKAYDLFKSSFCSGGPNSAWCCCSALLDDHCGAKWASMAGVLWLGTRAPRRSCKSPCCGPKGRVPAFRSWTGFVGKVLDVLGKSWKLCERPLA